MSEREHTACIGKEEILSLIPHKGRMVLLSRITSYNIDKHSLISEYDITPDCLFYRESLNGIPSWVGFELMAQSISAISGLLGREKGNDPQQGFILSVSELVLYTPVMKEGSTVCIDVEEDTALENIYSFNCRISDGKNAISKAKLTVMEADFSTVMRGSSKMSNFGTSL